MKLMRLLSYLSIERNILNNEGQSGGGYLRKIGEACFEAVACQTKGGQDDVFLKSIEKAKSDWQFSNQLLSETTDPDLIDYVIYLVKSNEAKYRYLLKVAREERITCALWQEQKINDM